MFILTKILLSKEINIEDIIIEDIPTSKYFFTEIYFPAGAGSTKLTEQQPNYSIIETSEKELNSRYGAENGRSTLTYQLFNYLKVKSTLFSQLLNLVKDILTWYFQ